MAASMLITPDLWQALGRKTIEHYVFFSFFEPSICETFDVHSKSDMRSCGSVFLVLSPEIINSKKIIIFSSYHSGF